MCLWNNGASCQQNIVEAEDVSCSYTGTIDSDNAGFSGTGFINTENAVGTAVTFNIYATSPTTINFGIRFANGSTDRPAQILVNGTEAVASLTMQSASFTDYQNSEADITLTSGINEISLVALDGGGFGSLDYFYFYGDAQFAGCEMTQTIELVGGWNLMSTYILSDDMFIPAFLPNATTVKTQNGFYSTTQPNYLNSLSVIEAGVGYLVYRTPLP